jgi:multiple sugar transport system substrate-binding protein
MKTAIPFLLTSELMKDWFTRWVIGFCLLLVLVLTSCQNRGLEKTTTITLSGWQSSPTEKQQLEQLLQDFQAQHPDIEVRLETITDQYMDVIKTRLIGDAAPDVFYLGAADAPLLMRHNVLEPLNSYITPDFELGDIKPELLNAFKLHGQIYGIPKDFSTLALYYNTQAFERANLTQPPQTWQELRQYARQLNRDRKPRQYGFGFMPELTRHAFMIKSSGGQITDSKGEASFASSKSIKGLQVLIDLYRRDRTTAIPADVGVSSGSEMLGQGKTAMVIEGSWAIPYLQETFPKLAFKTAEVPKLGNKKGTMAYTVAYVMNQQSKYKQAAWQLIAFLTDKNGMKNWTEGGLVLPTRRSLLAEIGYSQDPLYQPFVRGANYATIWQTNENLPMMTLHFDNQFLSALLGEQSLQVALEKAQNSANQELQASNY